LDDVTERVKRYLMGVGQRRVAPTREAVAGLSALDVPLQDRPIPPEEVVEELDRIAEPATLTISGPRFFGFVNGGSLPATVAVNWLATAWDQHGTFAATSPATTAVERIAMRWIIDLLGLPAESAGAFVTGTTVAHISALAAARDWLLSTCGWNIDAHGLFGAPPKSARLIDRPTVSFGVGLRACALAAVCFSFVGCHQAPSTQAAPPRVDVDSSGSGNTRSDSINPPVKASDDSVDTVKTDAPKRSDHPQTTGQRVLKWYFRIRYHRVGYRIGNHWSDIGFRSLNSFHRPPTGNDSSPRTFKVAIEAVQPFCKCASSSAESSGAVYGFALASTVPDKVFQNHSHRSNRSPSQNARCRITITRLTVHSHPQSSCACTNHSTRNRADKAVGEASRRIGARRELPDQNRPTLKKALMAVHLSESDAMRLGSRSLLGVSAVRLS
jgi:hypothetical protein